MNGEYRRKANGKFLLTGEYVVLKGAEALAIPLRMGQSMQAVSTEGEIIYWEGFAPGGKWLETALHSKTLDILGGEDAAKSERLASVIREIRKQNPAFWTEGGHWVRTDLDFDPAFGMGSSSTFLALLCDAAGVNPYPVMQATFGGSGYDLACAFARSPLIFSLKNGAPHTETVNLSPAVTSKLLFIYSGKKMVSSGEVKKFNSLHIPSETISQITEITRKSAACDDAEDFAELMQEHEQIMSGILEQPILRTRFPDFGGTVKSMGAWGGDFFMAVCPDRQKAVTYFRDKGFDTVYTYEELACQAEKAE